VTNVLYPPRPKFLRFGSESRPTLNEETKSGGLGFLIYRDNNTSDSSNEPGKAQLGCRPTSSAARPSEDTASLLVIGNVMSSLCVEDNRAPGFCHKIEKGPAGLGLEIFSEVPGSAPKK